MRWSTLLPAVLAACGGSTSGAPAPRLAPARSAVAAPPTEGPTLAVAASPPRSTESDIRLERGASEWPDYCPDGTHERVVRFLPDPEATFSDVFPAVPSDRARIYVFRRSGRRIEVEIPNVVCPAGTMFHLRQYPGTGNDEEQWCAYPNGDRHGPWIARHSGSLAGDDPPWRLGSQAPGLPHERGTYQDGLREGPFASWTKQGELQTVRQYRGDVLVDAPPVRPSVLPPPPRPSGPRGPFAVSLAGPEICDRCGRDERRG